MFSLNGCLSHAQLVSAGPGQAGRRASREPSILQLEEPLTFDHLGETKYLAGGHSVEFRANVAILSRNVVVQGEPLSQLDKHGAHIMLHSRRHDSIADRSQGESLTARIENIEVRYAGQMGRIGRYPIHFHMIGAVRNSYVRSNSIHHTYNRAIAIHGVHYLRCQDNVAFETRGHTFFVEDGLETKNVITGNLGANARENFVGLTSRYVSNSVPAKAVFRHSMASSRRAFLFAFTDCFGCRFFFRRRLLPFHTSP